MENKLYNDCLSGKHNCSINAECIANFKNFTVKNKVTLSEYHYLVKKVSFFNFFSVNVKKVFKVMDIGRLYLFYKQ